MAKLIKQKLRSLDAEWEGNDYHIDFPGFLGQDLDCHEKIYVNKIEKMIHFSNSYHGLFEDLAKYFQNGFLWGTFFSQNRFVEMSFAFGHLHNNAAPALVKTDLSGQLKGAYWYSRGDFFKSILHKCGSLYELDDDKTSPVEFVWDDDRKCLEICYEVNQYRYFELNQTIEEYKKSLLPERFVKK